jgi:hypothetical protein
VFASGEEIPDYLMMDLRGKHVGEKIMAYDVDMNEGLKLRTRTSNFAVAKFVGSRRGAGDEEEGEGGAAGDKVAAGKAAAAGDKAKPAAAKPAAAKKDE